MTLKTNILVLQELKTLCKRSTEKADGVAIDLMVNKM